tara:strand:+ start:765 stop:1172 length:408 start_codon:yes stop_codon:yes gene_type:complete
MGNIILGIAVFYGLVGFIEGWFDGNKSSNGSDIEHKFSFTMRVLGSIVIWHASKSFANSHDMSLLLIPIILLINSIGVDFGFNTSRGWGLGYIGRTSEWDKFIRKTPIGGDGILYQSLKLIAAATLFFVVAMHLW